ncbi:MAG: glyoxylase-like metal-dependent hydrolase (beta-lactamase superfamily II) [Rhodothermales bacterium]|jgi:glyoxylase-like metal-dependent hydrolase (beta-lactamase superfamily II)
MSKPCYQTHAIDAGRFGLDGGAMFGIVPRVLWSKKTQPDDAGRIPLSTRCLVLEGEGRLILIDAGIGDKFGQKHRGIYAMEDGPSLVDGLRAAGFDTGDVTDVILTHLHFDHCGGATEMRGGRSRTVFSNAVHHVQAAHWDWAMAGNSREQASFLAENLEPLAEEGNLNLISGEVDLLPGIRVEPVNGHTEAQQIVHIDGAGPEHLVFVADLIPTAHHLPPVWGMAYDIRPLVTINEKTDFLKRAVAGEWRLFFEHDSGLESGVLVSGERRPELRGLIPA